MIEFLCGLFIGFAATALFAWVVIACIRQAFRDDTRKLVKKNSELTKAFFKANADRTELRKRLAAHDLPDYLEGDFTDL